MPKVAFLRLVHLGRLAIFVFGRGWRINDRRSNRASTDFETVLLKILVDQVE